MTHEPPSTPAHDLRRLLCVLRRGWPVLAASVAACLTAAFAYLLLKTPLYEATVQLLVLQQGGRPFNVANGDPSRPLEVTDDIIPSHIAIVRSHAVVKRAIDLVGLQDLPTLRAVVEGGRDPVQTAIDGYLKVSRPERLAKVIRVDYRAPSPDESVRMAAAVGASYKKFLEEDYPRGNEVVALMERARRDLGVDVEKAEKEYLAFLSKHPMLVTDEKGRSLMTNRLERWDNAVNEAQVREAQMQAQLDLVKKLAKEGAGMWAIVNAMGQLGGSNNQSLLSFTTNAVQTTSWDYIRQLSVEQQQLAERYGQHYSKVQSLQEQITRIQERVRASRSRYEEGEIKDLIRSLEEGLKTSKAMRASMGRGFDQDRKAQSEALVEIVLRGNLERCRLMFKSAADQLTQAQVAGAFSPLSAITLRSATARTNMVSPRWALTLAIAVLLGLLAGVGLVVVRSQAQHRLPSAEEVREALGVPVLAHVPAEPAGEAGAAALVCHTLPTGPLSEAYKMLRTNLVLRGRQQPLRIIAVTSPHRSEGKTTTASNLAISLAQSGQRVLLVDADLRHPSLDRLFSLPPDVGLADVLRAAHAVAAVVQGCCVPNLYVLTAGPFVPNPAELLMSPRLKDFFGEARSDYEVVVVDCSPLLSVTDPCLLGSLADGTLLVVREGMTSTRDARAAAEALAAADAVLLGVVLNGTARSSSSHHGTVPGDSGGARTPAAQHDAHHRPVYPLLGRPPAEPDSVSRGNGAPL